MPQLPRWSAEDEEVKYGPFSDGEADTVSRILSSYLSLLYLYIIMIIYHISKYIYTQVRTRGQRCKKSRARHMSGAVSAVPHYATMSRCQQVNTEL